MTPPPASALRIVTAAVVSLAMAATAAPAQAPADRDEGIDLVFLVDGVDSRKESRRDRLILL